MPVHVRADVLRAYVERYGQDGWCRAGIGHGKMRQIAHPELGPVVQELWDRAYRGYEAREVLLELIWLTPLPDCADLALAALQDTALDIGHLTDAARGVLAVGNTDAKEMLKNMGLAHELPQPIIRYILPELFSNVLSNDEFLALIDSLKRFPGLSTAWDTRSIVQSSQWSRMPVLFEIGWSPRSGIGVERVLTYTRPIHHLVTMSKACLSFACPQFRRKVARTRHGDGRLRLRPTLGNGAAAS